MVAGLAVLAGGHLWLAYGPSSSSYLVEVLPGLALVAVGVALSFTPTTMVITGAVPETHTGLAAGLAGSMSQIGAAVGTATVISLGTSASGAAAQTLSRTGFSVAFTAAAVVALATALLGVALVRPRGVTAVSSRPAEHTGLPRGR
jgi:hypothetical protein